MTIPGVEGARDNATKPFAGWFVARSTLFEADQPRPGSGGHVSLWANDQQIGEGDIPRTVPIAFSTYAGMDIGRDNGLVVDRGYEERAPYPFTGTIRDVVFDLKPAHHEAEKGAA